MVVKRENEMQGRMKMCRAQTPTKKESLLALGKQLFQIFCSRCTGTFVHLPIVTVQTHRLLPIHFCNPYFKGKIKKTSGFSFSRLSPTCYSLLFDLIWTPKQRSLLLPHHWQLFAGSCIETGPFHAFPSPHARILFSSMMLSLEVFYNVNYT